MNQKIQVLHLIKSLGRGGAEMLLPETISAHHPFRYQFHCIYFLPWKHQMVSAIEKAGAAVTCLQASNNIQLLLKIPAIVKYCRQHKIDLIHCHLPWAGFAGRLVYLRTGIPVVYTEHNKQERYNKITATLNKLSFNWQREAIAVSDDVAHSILHNIQPRIRLETVLNGVNTEKFLRNETGGSSVRHEFGLPQDAIVIGTIAVFRFQKRLEQWLEVMKRITDKHPNVWGILVGDGPLNETLRQKRKELGLEEKVLMPGLQTNTEDWFSAMDIFMMSSVFEGLPIALLEAMSRACAIVATAAGGTKEVIRHETDGLLCSVEEWDMLPALAIRLIEQPELRRQLGYAARQRVQKAFSLDQMVARLEHIYERNLKLAKQTDNQSASV